MSCRASATRRFPTRSASTRWATTAGSPRSRRRISRAREHRSVRDIVTERPGEHIEPWIPRLRAELGSCGERRRPAARGVLRPQAARAAAQARPRVPFRTTPLTELVGFLASFGHRVRARPIRGHRHDDRCLVQSIFSVDVNTLIVAGVIACVAGVVRGITGFGGAMVMAPPLALLLGPQLAVPVILVLESVAAAPMLCRPGIACSGK